MPTQRSKSDKPPDCIETCLLCGAQVLCLNIGTMSENTLDVLKGSQWEIHHKSPIPEHIFVPSTEVEKKSFSRFPWLSSCYQRGAVRYASSSAYELMGIGSPGRFLWHQPSRLPRDPNTARITGREKRPQYDDITFTTFYPVSPRMDLNLYKDKDIGYVFHYCCWEILGHLMGKEVIEKTLGQVVQAAEQYWQTHEGWGIIDLDTMNHAQVAEAPYVRLEWYYFGCDIYVNPWIVPELQKTIQLARSMVGKRTSFYLNRLPLEISLLVAEIICPIIYTQSDVHDLRNMVSAFGLNLPDAFWRSRLQSKRDLFFEVDLLENDSVDWQHLWLGLMDLLSDEWYMRSGLAHRERVLKSIKGIIANIHKN